ncbi:MAG: membrane protein insertion efficiency factor YidD [Colwellia sp.]|nr:membrane protein insertion efficiency factor YidD [Colwellia sp.]
MLKNSVLKAIRYYQNTGGSKQHFATSCNFTPSCSHYTYQAIEHFGLWQGTRLGINRIRRCNESDCIITTDDPVPLFLPVKTR